MVQILGYNLKILLQFHHNSYSSIIDRPNRWYTFVNNRH